MAYAILAQTNVEGSAWSQWQSLVGPDNVNYIVTTAPTDDLTRRFFKAMSNEDTDGDGLPDAFELLVTHTDPNNADTGNMGIPDGYKDSDGDGWTHLDEMRNGTNPLGFNAPPAPQNFTAFLTGSSDALLKWAYGTGPKRFYLKLKSGQQYGRMTIELYAYYNTKTPGLVRINYAINPSGSRLLR